MTLLQVMPDNAPEQVLLRTRREAEIATALSAHSVKFRRWSVRGTMAPGMTEEELMGRYRSEIDQLCAEESLKFVDAVQLRPAPGPEYQERARKARAAFLEEHQHSEDEVRFFAHGMGCFYLHLDGKVFAVICEAGDLLSVPAGTRHWFDMGPTPEFAAIRFFEKENGWVGDFTEDPIAQSFPRLDALLQPAT